MAFAISLTVLMYLTVDYRKRRAMRLDLESMGAHFVRFGDGDAIHASFHDSIESDQISKYKKIAVLDLKEAHVTAESLKNLDGLEEIGTIVFSLSDVRDEHLEDLKSIRKVRHLWLSHTELTDACVDSLVEIPGLESIDVSNTSLTQDGITRLRDARPALIVRVE